MRRNLPNWNIPEGTNIPELLLYNSLTRKKERFVPSQGRQVTWYSCGPTGMFYILSVLLYIIYLYSAKEFTV